MNPNNPPAPLVAFCPRCFCPIDIRRTYNVDVCLPVQPPIPQGPPTTLPPAGQRPATDPPVYSPEPPAPQQDNAPPAPRQDSTSMPSPEPSGHLPTQKREPDRATDGEKRRSSASSSSSFDSAFTQFSYNCEFMEDLKAIEEMHFSKIPFKPSSSQPPPTSSQPPPTSSQPPPTSSQPPPSSQSTPPSSPFIESSSILTSDPTSSLSAESSLTPSAPGESPSSMRRWVVFRGRVPGVYTSSTEATDQTHSFPHAFMLAFDDPATANFTYEQFQLSGIVPTHGRGPWVVFIGRRPGVFTAYEELCASVIGFSNNCYRCCESVEEGTQALNAFMQKQAMILPVAQTIPGPAHTGHILDPATAADDSWWCCFAGAEPGVYKGLARLIQAAPATGGVRRVNSEDEGWELWTLYLANDEIRVVPRV